MGCSAVEMGPTRDSLCAPIPAPVMCQCALSTAWLAQILPIPDHWNKLNLVSAEGELDLIA